MRTTRDEIFMARQELNRITEKIKRMDRKDPDNRTKWAMVNSERQEMERKIEGFYRQLEEEYKNGTYVPAIGDERYSSFPNKRAIDSLRSGYYDAFGKDPSITYCGSDPMFNDPSLYVLANHYKIGGGQIPFELKITSEDREIAKDKEASVLATFASKHFKLADSDKYIGLVASFIHGYTDEDINLIYTDGALENIHFSRIDKSDYPFCVKRRYYQFFHNLFDNLGRNIVYVGDSMKDGVPLDEIQEVEESFIDSDHRIIARRNNMSEEELNNLNSDIRRKVLERH